MKCSTAHLRCSARESEGRNRKIFHVMKVEYLVTKARRWEGAQRAQAGAQPSRKVRQAELVRAHVVVLRQHGAPGSPRHAPMPAVNNIMHPAGLVSSVCSHCRAIQQQFGTWCYYEIAHQMSACTISTLCCFSRALSLSPRARLLLDSLIRFHNTHRAHASLSQKPDRTSDS